jgi:hypothetical protein
MNIQTIIYTIDGKEYLDFDLPEHLIFQLIRQGDMSIDQFKTWAAYQKSTAHSRGYSEANSSDNGSNSWPTDSRW